MATMLRPWDARPSLSINTSTTASLKSIPVETTSLHDARSDQVSISDSISDVSTITSEQWYYLATSLGVDPKDHNARDPSISKVAQKLHKRRNISEKDTVSLFTGLLVSLVTPHPRILVAKNAVFHREAVPSDIPKFGIRNQLKVGLAVPRPALVLGYNPQVFTTHFLELQQGIIAGPRGDPQDLGNISQTVDGMFWPFFVIDVDEKLMLAARSSCAGATSTCNNALMILAGTLLDPKAEGYDNVFIQSLSRAVRSFSLSICGKTACLMTHNSDASLVEAVAIIRSYDLDQEKDVQALCSRIRSIILWAQSSRLDAIMDLLRRFDQRVNFKGLSKEQEILHKLPLEYDPELQEPDAKKRRKMLKAVLSESMPSWSRAEV